MVKVLVMVVTYTTEQEMGQVNSIRSNQNLLVQL